MNYLRKHIFSAITNVIQGPKPPITSILNVVPQISPLQRILGEIRNHSGNSRKLSEFKERSMPMLKIIMWFEASVYKGISDLNANKVSYGSTGRETAAVSALVLTEECEITGRLHTDHVHHTLKPLRKFLNKELTMLNMGESRLRKLGVGRRMPDDPLFTAGDTLCRTYLREGIVDIDDEHLYHQIVAAFPCEVPGCRETFSSLSDFEMHYHSRHRFICSQCRKPLPSAHFLDLHLLESHDSFFAAQAERKPMYQCFVEECSVVSQDVAQRRSHCIEAHSFPHDFRYDQSLKKNKKGNQEESTRDQMKSVSEPMVVDEVQGKKLHPMKHFTFGHARQGKSFSRNNTPRVQKNDNHENNESAVEITTAELMDALPS